MLKGSASRGLQETVFGRSALRYNFEVIPIAVDGLPSGVEQVSAVLEKGDKVSYTDPSDVNQVERSASFSSIMRLTATIYKQGSSLQPKEYAVKIQSVRPSTSKLFSDVRRKTIARAKLDLAQFCSPGSATAGLTQFVLQLQPQGTLQLSVKAVWLQHYQQQRGSSKAGSLGSEVESGTDYSSQRSSASGESFDGEVPQATTSTQATAAEPSSAASAAAVDPTTPAATCIPTGRPCMVPYAAPGSNSLSTALQGPWHAQCAAAESSNSNSKHRRAISMPEHPLVITTIHETDKEGVEYSGSNLEPAPSPAAMQANSSAAASLDANPCDNTQLQQLQPPDDHNPFITQALPADAAEAEESEGPAGLRGLSSHLPAWMWPFSRDNTLRDATTEQLMQQIAASAGDPAKLQQLARGLLCDRNDWRYKATQWERDVQALQLQVEHLQHAKAGLLAQLHRVEGQVTQLQQNVLVDKLVEAKLQLAQADLQVTDLNGQLVKERERHRQVAGKLTSLQSQYESLLDQQEALHRQQQQSCKGEQGERLPSEGLGSPVSIMQAEAAVVRNTAAAAGTARRANGAGWGFGSFIWGAGGTSVAAAVAAPAGEIAESGGSSAEGARARRSSAPSGV